MQSACSMRLAGMEDTAELLEKKQASEISKMSLEEAPTLTRAFSHYLNLMGIAEVHHSDREANIEPAMSSHTVHNPTSRKLTEAACHCNSCSTFCLDITGASNFLIG
ncbi:phosphoenolpyruvate carboxylase 4 [Rosa chinensis]|uniref:phosphoenolpyruvate carboxylase 4 n=1 Tax=Rosa chinensis TaxID=74649 RepID=UPI000D088D5D|nr:phosphoenolpyruvate carboxylase 4 [Rosa chinensis]